MMTPAGGGHGRIVGRLTVRLGTHIETNKLGLILGAETGFLIERNPDTVRAPDVSFVAAHRTAIIPDRGYVQGVPDLAVEVLSPDDRPRDITAKVRQWLAAGCRMVWVVDPATRTITSHVPGIKPETYLHDQTVPGGAVVPGFELSVADVFAE